MPSPTKTITVVMDTVHVRRGEDIGVFLTGADKHIQVEMRVTRAGKVELFVSDIGAVAIRPFSEWTSDKERP